jgi:hypothetical protein
LYATVELQRHKNSFFKYNKKYPAIELQCPTVELHYAKIELYVFGVLLSLVGPSDVARRVVESTTYGGIA